MPFNKPAIAQSSHIELKLAQRFTGEVSPDDYVQFIKWLKDNKQYSFCALYFTHKAENVNKQVLINLLQNCEENIKLSSSTSISIKVINLNINCYHVKAILNEAMQAAAIKNKIITLEETISSGNDTDNFIQLATQMLKHAKSIELPDLSLNEVQWRSLFEACNASQCQIKYKGIKVTRENNVAFTEQLIQEFDSCNWSSRDFVSRYNGSTADPNVAPLLNHLSKRNQLLWKLQEYKPLQEIHNLLFTATVTPAQTSLDLSNLYLRANHLEPIFEYVLKYSEIQELSLKKNNLSVDHIINFVKSAIAKQLTLKFYIDTFVADIADGKLKELVFNYSELVPIFNWCQQINLADTNLQVNLSLSKQEAFDEKNCIKFLSAAKVKEFSLQGKEASLSAEQIAELCNYSIEQGIAMQLAIADFEMIINQGSIAAVKVKTTFILAFVNIIQQLNGPIKKIIIWGSLQQIIVPEEKTRAFNIFIEILTKLQTTEFEVLPYIETAQYSYGTGRLEEITLEQNDVQALCSNLNELMTIKFGNITIQNYWDKLKNNPNRLEFVLLSICGRNSIMSAVKENTLAKANVLDLNTLYLLPTHIPEIVQYLKQHEEIQKVNLSANLMLGAEGLNLLLEGLKESPWVTTLFLKHTGFSGTNMSKLREYLDKNFLVQLDLSNNLLRDAELSQLMEVIKTNKSLTDLNICHNPFSFNSNVKLLAEALRKNHTLTQFSFNTINDKAHVDTFFTALGWDWKKKKSNPDSNYRLSEIQFLDPGLQDKSEQKTWKELCDLRRKYTEHGNAKNKELTDNLINLARNGNDLAGFRTALEQTSPYTLAQEGYLQHILAENNHKDFLSYLLQTFHINPWLSFNNKTILDIAREKNDPVLQQIVQQQVDRFKAEAGVINAPVLSAPAAMTPSKRSANALPLSPAPASKRIKTEPPDSPVTPPHSAVTISASPQAIQASPLNSSSATNPPAIPAIQNAVTLNEQMSVFMLMQAFQTQNVLLLKTHWHTGCASFKAITQQSPLQYAMQVKAADCIPELIKLGENVNEINEQHWTLIYQFVSSVSETSLSSEQLEKTLIFLKALLQAGASTKDKVNDTRRTANTVVHKAAQLGNYRCLKLLLTDPYCPLNETNSQNYTPLMEAVAIRHLSMVTRLLLDRRHSRSTILSAKNLAEQHGFLDIKTVCEQQLEIVTTENRTSGIQWVKSLSVQFTKPAFGLQPVHVLSLDKEHAWLHSQNQFMQQYLFITNPEERARKLKQLGNPVTASLTFVMTAAAHLPHTQQKYLDITVPLQAITEYHLTQSFSTQVSAAERQAASERRAVLNYLPHYENFRHAYNPRDEENIAKMLDVDFVQTFRHGEISLLTHVTQVT